MGSVTGPAAILKEQEPLLAPGREESQRAGRRPVRPCRCSALPHPSASTGHTHLPPSVGPGRKCKWIHRDVLLRQETGTGMWGWAYDRTGHRLSFTALGRITHHEGTTGNSRSSTHLSFGTWLFRTSDASQLTTSEGSLQAPTATHGESPERP